MARREITVTIGADGRDKGKQFKLTELSAAAGERWAHRAFLALTRSGVTVPEYLMELGWAGLATLGMRMFSGVSYDEAQPLLDEMMSCVQIIEPQITRPLTEDDIEEIATITHLRREVFQLHVDFSKVAAFLKSKAVTDPKPGDTPTSPQSSDESSPPA